MSAARFQALNEILRILREEIDWTPEPGDKTKAIAPQAVVYRKIAGERDVNEGRTMEIIPGIFVSCPHTEGIPENAGENAHDEYRWRFLIQVVDSDNYGPADNIATYFLWQEKICRKLHFKCLQNVDAFKSMTYAAAVNVVDEKYWKKEELFKTGVEVLARVWLTRVSDGQKI